MVPRRLSPNGAIRLMCWRCAGSNGVTGTRRERVSVIGDDAAKCDSQGLASSCVRSRCVTSPI
jgi:hypothetical protein